MSLRSFETRVDCRTTLAISCCCSFTVGLFTLIWVVRQEKFSCRGALTRFALTVTEQQSDNSKTL